MGKEKKPKLGIKTSRYYTKKCDRCNQEYPNWFTNCPNCGSAWDEAKEIKEVSDKTIKNIKIVVKITEEDFNETITNVNLIFSANHGRNWYQMGMEAKIDYYIAEITDVPVSSIIIYYIEVFLANGEKFIENNEGKYFYYKVGAPMEETREVPPEEERQSIMENIKSGVKQSENHTIPDEKSNTLSVDSNNITIFGTPQTQIDPNLKTCPHCNSKIKEMWGVCPFCGKNV